MRQQLSNYDKDKMTLQLTKQRLLHADKQLKNLEWEKEVLSQRFIKIEAERNDLFAKFESSVHEMQQKTGLKKMLLEKKVEALNQALEKKQTQLAEVLVAANMDTGTLQNVRIPLLEPKLNTYGSNYSGSVLYPLKWPSSWAYFVVVLWNSYTGTMCLNYRCTRSWTMFWRTRTRSSRLSSTM